MNKLVLNFHKQFAKKFVDAYVNKNPIEAGYLVLAEKERINEEIARELIDLEFNSRGMFYDAATDDWELRE